MRGLDTAAKQREVRRRNTQSGNSGRPLSSTGTVQGPWLVSGIMFLSMVGQKNDDKQKNGPRIKTNSI